MLSGVLNFLFFEKYLTNFFLYNSVVLMLKIKKNYKNISKLKYTAPYHQRYFFFFVCFILKI
jgi:hypothetical protein